MKKVIILLFMQVFLFAQFNSTEIIKKVEDNLNGKSAYMKISMEVATKRTTK